MLFCERENKPRVIQDGQRKENAMTKELLEQYSDICAKIEELGRPLKDTVSGSSPVFPYTQHSITVFGFNTDRSAQMDVFEKQRDEIDAFIAKLPLPKQRLVQAVIKYGTKWNVVRRALDSSKSPDALRVEYERIFKNF